MSEPKDRAAPTDIFAVSQSVKWQEMERAVGHDNEVLPLEKWAQRRDEFAIERFQMAERGTQIKLDREIRLTIAYDWTAITAICRRASASRCCCTEPDVEGRGLGF